MTPITNAFRARLIMAVLALFFSAAASLVSRAQGSAESGLDSIRLQLDQIEATLRRPDLADQPLVSLRDQLEPLRDRLRELIAERQPDADALRARLEQLGPKPDAAKGQSEAPAVQREREAQEKLRGEAEGFLRLARTHAERAEELQGRTADRRRALFTKALLERSASILSPGLWLDVVRSLPREAAAARVIFGDWGAYAAQRFRTAEAVTALLIVLAAGIGFSPLRRLIRRFDGRPADGPPPGRKERALAALRVISVRVAVALLAAAVALEFFTAFDLVPQRMRLLVTAAVLSIAVVFSARAFAKGMLAPAEPRWRVLALGDIGAATFSRLAVSLTAVAALSKTIEALFQAISAPLRISIVSKGFFAVLGALLILATLRAMRSEAGDEAAPGGSQATQPDDQGVISVFRLGAAPAAIIALAACIAGYVALAAFLLDQLLWISALGLVLVIAFILIDEVFGHGMTAEGAVGRQMRQTLGVQARSLKQVSVLGSGALRLGALLVAGFLALAPWGVDSADVTGTLRAAFFGFSLGGITVSLSALAAALLLFGLGFAATRAAQRWLDTQYLPHTGLEPGLRNSVVTILGYTGVLFAVLIAMSQLGISMERLTLVAGALSVGIGFGLQSIVNNFVSGLILLWERPIRVGDWIVVGEEQGLVRRINVRATEIETFDHASIIVPNSEFISGKVKNWVHSDRLGRVIIPVGVAYGVDPEQIRAILRDAALGHMEVMSEPAPRVFFARLSENTLDFELRCFTDVDSMMSVKSDLLFEIFRRLREAGVVVPQKLPPAKPQDAEAARGRAADGPRLPAKP